MSLGVNYPLFDVLKMQSDNSFVFLNRSELEELNRIFQKAGINNFGNSVVTMSGVKRLLEENSDKFKVLIDDNHLNLEYPYLTYIKRKDIDLPQLISELPHDLCLVAYLDATGYIEEGSKHIVHYASPSLTILRNKRILNLSKTTITL
jgi:hypothetical protein